MLSIGGEGESCLDAFTNTESDAVKLNYSRRVSAQNAGIFR